MSDNIEAQEIRRRLVIYLRIPNEVWTDVFKLLPRRNLVQNIAPVSHRFKEISDKNVKTIHLIKRADQFKGYLQYNSPLAKKQLSYLLANKRQLASQFHITKMSIDGKSKVLIRHCLDSQLLQGCQIKVCPWQHKNNSAFIGECFTFLEQAKPVMIKVVLDCDPGSKPDQLMRHPTVWNCNWISISSSHSPIPISTLFEWLHQKPTEVEECDGVVAAVQQVRSMIFYSYKRDHVESLLKLCVENLQQSQVKADRRQFVFSFGFWPSIGFENKVGRIENDKTGETLALERVAGHPNATTFEEYRLRRCLTEQIGDQAEFYAKMFKWGGHRDEFNNIDKNGAMLTEVEIEMTDWAMEKAEYYDQGLD